MMPEISREDMIEAMAKGMERFLVKSDAGRQFEGLIDLLRGVHLLKESLLTADQAAKVLGISRRTFDRQVVARQWRKEESLGASEPRYWLMDIIAVLERDHKPAALDPSKTRWVDFAGAEVVEGRVRRQRKAA